MQFVGLSLLSRCLFLDKNLEMEVKIGEGKISFSFLFKILIKVTKVTLWYSKILHF